MFQNSILFVYVQVIRSLSHYLSAMRNVEQSEVRSPLSLCLSLSAIISILSFLIFEDFWSILSNLWFRFFFFNKLLATPKSMQLVFIPTSTTAWQSKGERFVLVNNEFWSVCYNFHQIIWNIVIWATFMVFLIIFEASFF